MRQVVLMLVIAAACVGCCKKCDSDKNANGKNGMKKEAVQPKK